MSHTAQNWAESFLNRLEEAHCKIDAQENTAPIVPRKFKLEPVMEAWKQSRQRLLMIGLVGTITSPKPPKMSFQQFLKFAKVPLTIKKSLKTLAADPNTTVVVVTSRRREYTEKLIGDTGAWVCAENGFFSRKTGSDQWTCASSRQGADDLSWMTETGE
eukprot:TRINITY_DN5385_c0_g1_i1.p1 TRINITY_DN5385_c0_g1~~TRINITY_DN5385_c0_g1_i1.p1  ORF type:complete len:177 (+),score=44.38 TRINITY_DN5385_c0_g1_i1:57-533(+)